MKHKPVPDSKCLNTHQLIDQYGDSLLRMCFLYLHDLHLAEDAVQETYIRVYQNWDKFRHDCSEKTWVTSIAMNVCRTQLRSSWYKRVFLNNSLIHANRHEDALVKDDTVLTEIAKLKPIYKEVILLFYYQEMKTKEIAIALDVTETVVCVRLNRARKKLKQKLEGWFLND